MLMWMWIVVGIIGFNIFAIDCIYNKGIDPDEIYSLDLTSIIVAIILISLGYLSIIYLLISWYLRYFKVKEEDNE